LICNAGDKPRISQRDVRGDQIGIVSAAGQRHFRCVRVIDESKRATQPLGDPVPNGLRFFWVPIEAPTADVSGTFVVISSSKPVEGPR
jgi:hypothetical protein